MRGNYLDKTQITVYNTFNLLPQLASAYELYYLEMLPKDLM